MNSPLKFPRRVRIHGGECGAVARALHHEAQKVALTQNEQMFSSDVKGLMRQADRKKSLRSTLIERKQMSTKTSIKRIALVAVSALGFGLLSVMPASAGTVSASVGPVRVSYTDGVRDTVAAAEFKFTPDANITAAGTNDTTITLTQAPTSTAEVTVIINGHTVKDTLGGSGTQIADTTFTASYASGTAITGSLSVSAAAVSGTYKGNIVLRGNATTDVTVNFEFTTRGKVATISSDAASYSMPPIVQTSANVFAISKTVTVSLKDSNGFVTQAATGDSVTATIADATNVALKASSNNAASAAQVMSDSDLNDGTHAFLAGAVTTTADSETVTMAPAGIMPAQGVANATFTVTSVAYGTETGLDTVLSSPSSTTIVAAGTAAGAEASYLVDETNTSYVFNVSGYTAGAAYKIQVLWADSAGGNGTATVKDDTANTTAASLTSATATDLYGLVGSSGTVKVTVSVTANNGTGDTIKVNPQSATAGDYDDAADALVTNQTTAYRVKISSPSVTPSMSSNGSQIAVTGDVKDQYANPVIGATVTVTGTVTSTDSSPNLVETAVTDATGAWSLTLPASTAASTVVTIRATAVKSGLTILASNNAAANGADFVVNLTASGTPSTMTFTNVNADNQDPALATTAPAIRALVDGTAGAASDEVVTIATGVLGTALEAADELADFTVATNPGSQVVVTGSSDVLLYSAVGGTIATGKTTLTVASGATVYALARTVGSHTVTFTSGTLSKTWKFFVLDGGAANQGDAIRNLSVDKSVLTLKPSEIGYITISAKDVFGNLIKNAVNAGGASITVKASGSALLDGPAISKTFTTTDENGEIFVGVIAAGAPGTATITITGTGAQLGAAVGAVSGTTAGTNGFTASTSSVTVTVNVAGSAEKSAEVLAAEAANDAALDAIDAATAAEEAAFEAIAAADAATVAAEEAKEAAEAATTAIEELSSQVATLMAALQAQITTLANTVAKILKRLPKK